MGSIKENIEPCLEVDVAPIKTKEAIGGFHFGMASALLCGGLLMGLAPVNAWPLAWVALVPLWWLARLSHLHTRSALGYAAIWGVAYHGVALSWITGLHPMMWMGVSWLGSVSVTLFSWMFITIWGAAIGMIWTGLMMAVSRWRCPMSGVPRVLLGTALWCAIEWTWSQGPLYWSSLSYTQSPHNLLGLQLSQLSGPMTVTAAVVGVNGLFSEMWKIRDSGVRRFRIRQHLGRINLRFGAYAIALFLGLHLIGLILYSRPLADGIDTAISVGLIQGNIPTNQKLTDKGIQTSQRIYLNGYESLAEAGADLVLTPEGAIPQAWNASLQDRNLFQQAVTNSGIPLVLGTFAHQNINDSRTPLMQSLLLLTPDSSIAGRYNKVKLVPLGEYIPFEKVLKPMVDRLSPFAGKMTPGEVDQLLKTPFGPMATRICYESAFAELFRWQVKQGGQAIFTASNNDPYSPRQMMQHHALDVMRAIESDRWEVRVTNTGISGVVDPRGRSRWLSAPNEYAIHIATIYKRQTRTLYVRWGDWLTPLLLASAVIDSIRRVKEKPRKLCK